MIQREITYIFREGFQSLRRNPLRSFLTIIGIVVGVAAVVTVLAIGKGYEAKIETQIQQLGALWFWVEPQRSYNTRLAKGPGRVSQRRNQVQANLNGQLSSQDAQAIMRSCSEVKWTAAVSQYSSQTRLKNEQIQVDFMVTTPYYQKVKSLQVLSGRYLTHTDLLLLRKVCVIEEQAGLFTTGEPLPSIRLQGHEFEIVGIFKRSATNPLSTRSVKVHIPATTAKKVLGLDTVQRIVCKARAGRLEQAMKQVQEMLQTRSSGNLNYLVQTTRDLFRRTEEITKTATLVTAGIGMLSLFVGGIGIMNILLASILERMREIGIRKTVGARKRDILLQFLFESILLSGGGGLLGILLGIFSSKLLGTAIDIPVELSFEAITIAFSSSALVGITFGVYPALKAARLSPVEALRYE